MEELTAWLKFGITLITFVVSALGVMKMFIAYLEKRDLTIAGAFKETLKEALLQEGRHISHEQTAEILRTKIAELKEEHAETRESYKEIRKSIEELRKSIEEGATKTHQRIDKLFESYSKTPHPRTKP